MESSSGSRAPHGWNFADVWETVAAELPDQPALIHGARTVLWADFDRRASGLASALVTMQVRRQEHVAQLLPNCPEYSEAVFGCFKGSFVPVNTNFRYTPGELAALWNETDVAAVVFHSAFATATADARKRAPRVRHWICVRDGAECPPFAVDYEDVVSVPPGPQPWHRSGDDLYILCTGGTTGLPKGVMWRQADLYDLYRPHLGDPQSPDLRAVELRVETPAPAGVMASPLMHGAAGLMSFYVLSRGGAVVTLPTTRFDAVALLDAVSATRADLISIVGDAFALPIVEAIEARRDGWDLSSVHLISSSGAVWSEGVKSRLTVLFPNAILVDELGSSEAAGMGEQIGVGPSARFRPGPNTRVIDESDRDIRAGSGEIGRVAVAGPGPIGYYNDPEKTAATFRVIDGIRYVIPGDFATVEADGSITFLGRGSGCINTGGEKVFPEEVENALRRSAGVRDVAVVGEPDERLGERLVAIIESTSVREADAAVKQLSGVLAPYKVPRRIITVGTVPRFVNGKLDYAAVRQVVASSPSGHRARSRRER